MKSLAAALVVLAAGAQAAPVFDTPYAANAPTDADILNYALTLEHLEDKFYREGLANFTQAQFAAAGYDDVFYSNLQKISSDESTHVNVLTSALTAAGAPPTAECTYSFNTPTVASFLATAAVLEGVGVSAYLGAAQDILSKQYLTAAGSILTIEARHAAYLREHTGERPFPAPFDTPLDLNEVYTLASAFIVSCPASNPALPVKAFPALTMSPNTSVPVAANQTVHFTTSSNTLNAQLVAKVAYAAFITITGPVFVPLKVENGAYAFCVTIPSGLAGQNYLVLTNNPYQVTDDTVIAGPSIVEIGS